MRGADRFHSVACLAIACLLGLPALAGAQPGPHYRDGLSLITSRKGSPEIVHAGGTERSNKLHAIQPLSATSIRTAKDEYLFIALSNYTAIGLEAQTEVEILDFRQAPYPSEKEDTEFEPSTSSLILSLKQGKLAVSADRLSALSELVIKLPFGRIRIHSANAILRYDETGVQVSVYHGSLTYYYPDESGREFITARQQIRISDQSATFGRVAESGLISGDEENALIRGTENASRRVAFVIGAADPGIPAPVLIAKPDKIREMSPRPYRFRD